MTDALGRLLSGNEQNLVAGQCRDDESASTSMRWLSALAVVLKKVARAASPIREVLAAALIVKLGRARCG